MKRRTLIRAATASAIATSAAPVSALFDPCAARAAAEPLRVLTSDQAAAIEGLCDAIVPGARDAGVAHYIDHELSGNSPRLLLRFAQLPGPMTPYYTDGIAAFSAAVMQQKQAAFASLRTDDQHAIIEALRTGTLAPWANAVAPPVFFGMMRNDGVDVVYGSIDGFKRLGMPYMPHIAPTTTW